MPSPLIKKQTTGSYLIKYKNVFCNSQPKCPDEMICIFPYAVPLKKMDGYEPSQEVILQWLKL